MGERAHGRRPGDALMGEHEETGGRPRVSVIIVNYNVKEFLLQAIASVKRAAEHVRAEIIVGDNNSVDGSVQAVRETHPEVRLIENQCGAVAPGIEPWRSARCYVRQRGHPQ